MGEPSSGMRVLGNIGRTLESLETGNIGLCGSVAIHDNETLISGIYREYSEGIKQTR